MEPWQSWLISFILILGATYYYFVLKPPSKPLVNAKAVNSSTQSRESARQKPKKRRQTPAGPTSKPADGPRSYAEAADPAKPSTQNASAALNSGSAGVNGFMALQDHGSSSSHDDERPSKVLRVTEAPRRDEPIPQRPKKDEPAETKKQRQNRKKREAQKVARAEDEEDRQRAYQAQKRVVRNAEKTEQKPAPSVWTKPSQPNELIMLDTQEDVATPVGKVAPLKLQSDSAIADDAWSTVSKRARTKRKDQDETKLDDLSSDSREGTTNGGSRAESDVAPKTAPPVSTKPATIYHSLPLDTTSGHPEDSDWVVT